MSRKYEERLENEIDGLNYRIVVLKNEVIETKYIKDVRYKEVCDKLDNIKILLNHQNEYKYKQFVNILSNIIRGIY